MVFFSLQKKLSGNAETRRHKSNLIAAYAPILPLDLGLCDIPSFRGSGHNGVNRIQREEDVPRDISIGVALRRGSIVMRLLVCKTGNSMGLILEARSSVPFFITKSVAYGKAVEIDDSLQKPCRRGRTLFTLFNTSDRGRNLPGLFVRGMIYQS